MFYNKLDLVHKYCTFKWCQNHSGNENILGILLMNSYDLWTTPTTKICRLSPLNWIKRLAYLWNRSEKSTYWRGWYCGLRRRDCVCWHVSWIGVTIRHITIPWLIVLWIVLLTCQKLLLIWSHGIICVGSSVYWRLYRWLCGTLRADFS